MQQLCFRVTWKTDQSTQSFLFDKTLILTLPPTWNWGSAFDPPPLSRYFSFSKNVYFWHKCVSTSFCFWGFLGDIKVFCPSSRSVDGDMSCTVTWCQLICGIDIKWFWFFQMKWWEGNQGINQLCYRCEFDYCQRFSQNLTTDRTWVIVHNCHLKSHGSIMMSHLPALSLWS